MKNFALLLGLLSMMTGCATHEVIQEKVDIEPILVGKPISQKVQESQQSISDQLSLLNKIQNKEKVGTYKVVTHNNDLDARVGSSRTIPQYYAAKETAEQVKVNKAAVVETKKTVETDLLKVKINSIDWKNDSLNKLAEKFAGAINYKLIITENNYKDVNTSFKANKITVEEAILKFKNENSAFATVELNKTNKSLNIIYK